MLCMEKLYSDLNLARREIKNIRQESLKQKASLNSEISKIKSLLSVNDVGNNAKRCNASENVDKMYLMTPIGCIESCFNSKNGIPRQPSLCPSARGILTIKKSVFTNPEHSLMGLEEFSHVWVLFLFHENGEHTSVKAKIHPPRLNGSSVGVFSTRSPHRPSPIGLSLIKLDKIEGSTLHLSGIDLLNGTPVLDIKPYIPLYDVPCVSMEDVAINHKSSEQRLGDDSLENNYSCNSSFGEPVTEDSSIPFKKGDEFDNRSCNVAPYLKKPPVHLNVLFTNRAMEDLESISVREDCTYDYLESKETITEILRNDPRSVYRRQKCSDRLYYFCINNLHVTCWFDDDIAEILRVKFKNKDVIK